MKISPFGLEPNNDEGSDVTPTFPEGTPTEKVGVNMPTDNKRL